MKRGLSLPFLLLLLFMHGGCAPAAFQRTGSPRDFIETGRTSTALHGLPNAIVNINVGGQQTGAVLGILLYGPVGWLANAGAQSSDKSANQEVLDALIRRGLREYTQASIAGAYSDILADSNNLKPPSDVFLDSSTDEAMNNDRIAPTTAEILAVDSLVAFYVAFSNFPSGATEGFVTGLTIRARYFSSGAERKTIWEDVFMCDLEPASFGENLVENDAYRAKQLVSTAITRLKPWMQRELQLGPYDRYPRIRITYKYPRYSGLVRHNFKEEGWLLQDRDNILVVRQLKGITRVLPREYVKEMEFVR